MSALRVLRSWHPIQSLTIIFVLWKSLILLLTVISPGPGYDTSTSLLGAGVNATSTLHTPSSADSLLKLVRWDAIYFTQMAQRGHLFEQEWAFGVGISNALSWTTKLLPPTFARDDLAAITIGGILLSHFTHWVSVILVWLIAECLRQADQPGSVPVPLVAAVLHIISPAGIFLSAPYSESLFASLNMSGFLMYIIALSRLREKASLSGFALFIIAGVAFGSATVVRSNGILSGLLYAFDAITTCLAMVADRAIMKHLLKLTGLILGGGLTGLGILIPQYFAYQEYCTGVETNRSRPWCKSTIPAIYTFVQSHYWNVGLFRYWTLPNLPLFLLAAPTLLLLTYSATTAIATSRSSFSCMTSLTLRLALPQLVLAVMALTSYHVQIIARLSSGYPLWYIWLAAQICGKETAVKGEVVVRWMVLYALIQAGLYASFLPPA